LSEDRDVQHSTTGAPGFRAARLGAARLGFRARGLAVLLLPLLALPACAIRDRMTGEAAAKHIRAVGVAADATVLQIWDTGITVNNDPVVGFLLDVKPDGRPAYQAKTKALISRLAVPRIQPGATLRVKYDPNDPAQVALDSIH
jgi:hypothetical protein